MVNNSISLTLNGMHYECVELVGFCMSQIKREDIPAWEEQFYRFILEWLSDDEFVVVQTSGSTGIPKLINQLKKQMINSARMTASYFGLDTQTNALLCLPVSYIAGKMMVVRAFVTGMNLITVEPSSNPFSKVSEKINFVAITPFQLVHSLGTLDEMKIDSVIVGGGEIPYDLELKCQTLSSNIFATYGMTETSSHIAIRAVNGVRRSTYYELLHGVTVSVDSRSCLVINAPEIIQDLLITNDVVAISDSSHFEWIGRFDSVINSGGVKIFPEQVEKKIFSLISERFFIAGLPDPLLGEKVTLFLETGQQDPEQFKDLESILKNVLTKFEMPRQIVLIPVFNLSDAGKILKKLIVSNYLK